MDIFCHLRRYVRLIALCLLVLVCLKALFWCSPIDIILILGLVLILLAVACTPW